MAGQAASSSCVGCCVVTSSVVVQQRLFARGPGFSLGGVAAAAVPGALSTAVPVHLCVVGRAGFSVTVHLVSVPVESQNHVRVESQIMCARDLTLPWVMLLLRGCCVPPHDTWVSALCASETGPHQRFPHPPTPVTGGAPSAGEHAVMVPAA